MKNWFEKNYQHLAIIGVFVIACFLYFPAAWQGKELFQQDVLQAQASQKEIMDIQKVDGDIPLWTNSMFGGMPTYQIFLDLPSNVGTYIMRGIKSVMPHPLDVVFLYLVGAYLLFSVLRVRPWLAALGAFAFAFSSYNFIYIEAGHASKAYAIAFLAPILAGIILTYRGKYLLGGVLLAFAVALEVRVNHIQVPYYMFIGLIIFTLIQFYHFYKEGKLKDFAKAIGVQGVTLVLAIAVNASLLWPTYEYSQLSIRGKSNLNTETSSENNSGLEKEYAYQWSQGVGETVTFLIPHAYGGGMAPLLDEDSHAAKLFRNNGASIDQAKSIAQSLPTYWGDKPFTSGPWYFGAGVVMLFIFGLFFVKGTLKWWLASSTLLFLLLSFGKNFPLVSDLFFNYFPMYNKFRAVESTLIIVTLLVPVLAVLAIQQVIDKPEQLKDAEKKLKYTFFGVGGFVLIMALMPDLFFSFKAPNHQEMVESFNQQIGDRQFAQDLGNALIKDRVDLAKSDAYRTLLILILTFGVVFAFIKGKLQTKYMVILLGVITLFDLWSVDKRYLNDSKFVDSKQLQRQFNSVREVDELIKLDKGLHYRVLDLTTNTFQDARPSYFHKSIGGYHAAKLMRYQELIENHFSAALNEDVLDMLNTRYLIVGDNQNNQRIQRRSTAAGNAWFVDRIFWVNSNEEEIQAISSFDAKKEAFIHAEFKDQINESRLNVPANAEIKLTKYRPDHLVYEYSSPNDAIAVFSEVYYDKGWKAFVDGKELPILRANYVLRALQLPGGNHTVEFKFEPASYKVGEIISLIASIILVLGAVLAIYLYYKKSPAQKSLK